MDWKIDIAAHARRSRRVARVKARWVGASPVSEAGLSPGGAGVRSTSSGGSHRVRLTRFDAPLDAVFRWDEDAVPLALLSWTDARGRAQEKRITLA